VLRCGPQEQAATDGECLGNAQALARQQIADRRNYGLVQDHRRSRSVSGRPGAAIREC